MIGQILTVDSKQDRKYLRRKKAPIIFKGAFPEYAFEKENLLDKISSSPEVEKDLTFFKINDETKTFLSKEGDILRAKINLGDYIKWMKSGDNQAESFYMGQLPIRHLNDMSLMFEYNKIPMLEDIKILTTNFWLGKKSFTPLHYDNSYNLLLQVSGQKRVGLISPKQGKNLYYTREKSPNISQVLDPESYDRERYNQFPDSELHFITLEPGDALYMPPHWSHTVRSQDVSISVNYWWNKFKFWSRFK